MIIENKNDNEMDAPAVPLGTNAHRSSWVSHCPLGRFLPGSSPVYPEFDPISFAIPADKSNTRD